MSWKCSYSHLIIFKFYNGIQLIWIHQLGKKSQCYEQAPQKQELCADHWFKSTYHKNEGLNCRSNISNNLQTSCEYWLEQTVKEKQNDETTELEVLAYAIKARKWNNTNDWTEKKSIFKRQHDH